MWDITKHGPSTLDWSQPQPYLKSSQLCRRELETALLRIVSHSQPLVPDFLSIIGHGILGQE